MAHVLYQGDCLFHLRDLPDDELDSLVTDPPAGISFMGKAWDGNKGGRDQWIVWMQEVMAECLRVLKPGAHGLVWALPRTSHWTATALENAGFEIRDVISHIFATGFPKSHNIGKSTEDKQWDGWGTALKPATEMWILIRKSCINDPCEEIVLSAIKNTLLTMHGLKEAEALLVHMLVESSFDPAQKEKILCVGRAVNGLEVTAMSQLTKAIKSIDLSIVSSWKNISDEDLEKVKTFTISMLSKQITELKTSCYSQYPTIPDFTKEHYILIRKPLGEKTVAKNVLKHGTGGLNIDASRVGTESTLRPLGRQMGGGEYNGRAVERVSLNRTGGSESGRFPANLVLSHHADCELVGTKEIKPHNGSGKTSSKANGFRTTYVGGEKKAEGFSADHSKETVPDYLCHDECAVAEIDRQSGEGMSSKRNGRTTKNKDNSSMFYSKGWEHEAKGYADTGGASRFFYCAKASRKDKGSDNNHPTVKNTKLMEYLIRMITPEGGAVLDPFMGSGSTGVAALRAGFEFCGIEQSEEYFEIADKRLNNEESFQWL